MLRQVRDIAWAIDSSYRFTAGAMDCLQEVTEAFITSMFEDMQIAAIHASKCDKSEPTPNPSDRAVDWCIYFAVMLLLRTLLYTPIDLIARATARRNCALLVQGG